MTSIPDFSSSVALVTGAGRGLGRAVTKELVRLGAHVIAIASSRTNLEELDDEISSLSPIGSLILAPLDLTKPDKIEGLIGGIHQRFKKLDILFANAAVLGNLSPLDHTDNDNFTHTMNVNLFANLHLIRLAHPLLLQTQHPRAAFVTCHLGRNTPFFGPYQASKQALETLVLTYAQEHKNTKLRTNLILPPLMKTQLFLHAFPGHKNTSSPPPPSPQLVASILSCLSLHEQRHGCTIDMRQ